MRLTCKPRTLLTTKGVLQFAHIIAEASFGFYDKPLAWLHSLCPFCPATVVQASLLCRKASFCECSVNNSCRDPGATAVDDGFRGLYALGLEDCLELRSWEESFVFGVEKVGDWDWGRIRDMPGRETYAG